jgi:predicted transcriptional regulator
MGAAKAKRVALLSIHPRYAEAIFDGTKRVEFRRKPLAADVTHVVVYATLPVGKVVGWFEVDDIVEGSPTRIWNTFAEVGGIDRSSYRAYFRNARRAFGITVGRTRRLKAPKPLNDVAAGTRPPQSFQYLHESVAQLLLAL